MSLFETFKPVIDVVLVVLTNHRKVSILMSDMVFARSLSSVMAY